MKKYNIMSEVDFDNFVTNVKQYFTNCSKGPLKFQPFTIKADKYKKDKSDRQHKFYWVCITYLQKAQKENGEYPAPKEALSNAVKIACGFTEIINTPKGEAEIPKSFKDASSAEVNELISFIHYWAADKYNYIIPEADSEVFYI